MRSFGIVVVLFAACLSWLAWRTSASTTSKAQAVAAATAAPSEILRGNSTLAPLVVPEDALSTRRSAPTATSSTPTGLGVERPKNFARLQFLVTNGVRPVAGALVHIDENVDSVFDALIDEQQRARTDEHGRVSAYVRASRVATIRVSDARSGLSLMRGVTTPLEGADRHVTLNLGGNPGAKKARLRVVSQVSGAPIPDVLIQLVGADHHGILEFRTRGDGRTETRCAPLDQLSFEVAGYKPREMSATKEDLAAEWTVELRPYARLHGRIAGFEHLPEPREISIRLRQSGDQIDAERERRLRQQLNHPSSSLAAVNADGTWSFDEVFVPESGGALTDLSIDLRMRSMRRTIPVVGHLRAGDDIEVLDPWADGAPWQIEFVDPLGRPAAPGGRIQLHFEDERDPTFGARLDSATVTFPFAGRGEWRYRLIQRGYLDQKETVELGTVFHNGSGRTRVVLDHTHIAGELVGELKGLELGVTLAPRGASSQDAGAQTEVLWYQESDGLKELASLSRITGFSSKLEGHDSPASLPEPTKAAASHRHAFVFRRLAADGEWDLLLLGPDASGVRGQIVLSRTPVNSGETGVVIDIPD